MGQGGRISCLLDENMENNRVFTYPLMQLQLFVNSSHSQTIQWSAKHERQCTAFTK